MVRVLDDGDLAELAQIVGVGAVADPLAELHVGMRRRVSLRPVRHGHRAQHREARDHLRPRLRGPVGKVGAPRLADQQRRAVAGHLGEQLEHDREHVVAATDLLRGRRSAKAGQVDVDAAPARARCEHALHGRAEDAVIDRVAVQHQHGRIARGTDHLDVQAHARSNATGRRGIPRRRDA